MLAVSWSGVYITMATQCFLSFLLGMLLIFSLLLPTTAAQHGEATHRRVTSWTMSRRLGVTLSASMRGRNSYKLSDSGLEEPERMKDLASLPDKVSIDDTPGPALRADDFVKDSESAKRGLLGHSLDAKMTLAPSNSSRASDQLQCEYTVVIQTGNQDGAGTNSDIRLLLSNNTGDQVYFKYLQNGHRTFEKGHKDTFVFRDFPCISHICQMVLYTDDYGLFSEWFVVSLKLNVATILHDHDLKTSQILQVKEWGINEWLPKENTNEELYTIRDDCNTTSSAVGVFT